MTDRRRRLGWAHLLPVLFVCTEQVACAPPADFRPPSALMLGDRSFEVGAGFVNVSKRPWVEESSRNIGQSWFTARANSWLSLSAISAFDKEGALGGASALFRVVHTDRFVLGTSAEAGYAWAGASVSSAVRVLDDSWVYAAPRVANWGDVVSVGIPFGLSIHVVSGFHLRTEVQWSWAELKYYNRRVHTGIAAAYDF
jgi:hypothetical protein